jgi:hypothetical protein
MSEKIPNVTEKSTKEQILNAFNQVVGMLEEKSKSMLNPEKENAVKKEAVVVASAESILSKKLKDDITKVNSKIIDSMNEMLTNMNALGEEYNTLVEALGIKKAALKEMFDIEANAYTLAALVNTHNELKGKLQKELDDIRNLIQEERKQWQDEKAKENDAIIADRKKSDDEWRYAFNRKHIQDVDALNDTLAATEKAFKDKLEIENKKLLDRTEEISKKEKEIANKEVYIADLEEQVKGIPALVEDAKTKATADAEASAKRTYNFQKVIDTKEFEGKLAAADIKNESLTQEVARLSAELRATQQKLDAAYSELKDLANKTVEGSANSKTISMLEGVVKDMQKSGGIGK